MQGRTPKPHFIQFGPPIPVIPFGHFVQEKYGDEFYEQAWHLVGPTIEKNLQNYWNRPHIMYCIAFIEGMRMATHMIAEHENASNTRPSPRVETRGVQTVDNKPRMEVRSNRTPKYLRNPQVAKG